MLWTVLAAGAGIAGLAMILILLRGRRGRKRPEPGLAAVVGKTAVPGAEVEASTSLYGLAPTDAMRFRRAARAQMHREQALWGRDYLPAASDPGAVDPGMPGGALPGRISGIPRTLRVRR